MSFPKTILMIEDDAPTREVVRMACVGQNLNLIEADTGEKGMEMIEKSEPDLVILDLNLPGVSGMDVCRQLRADGTQVPVIMLTAKNDTIDVVVGLEVGADDYLTKPFEVREQTVTEVAPWASSSPTSIQFLKTTSRLPLKLSAFPSMSMRAPSFRLGGMRSLESGAP